MLHTWSNRKLAQIKEKRNSDMADFSFLNNGRFTCFLGLDFVAKLGRIRGGNAYSLLIDLELHYVTIVIFRTGLISAQQHESADPGSPYRLDREKHHI